MTSTMPSSPIEIFPLTDSSTHSNFDCTVSIPVQYYTEDSENVSKTYSSLQLNDGSERPIVSHSTNILSKRRYTFSGQEHKIMFKKRRRLTSIALPTKFLLGGNRTDPLNLSSLESDKSSQSFKTFSPASSPMPLPSCQNQVQLIIPSNINDPLNLSTEAENKISFLSAKARKRRRHRRGRRDEYSMEEISQITLPEAVSSCQIAPDGMLVFQLDNDVNFMNFKKDDVNTVGESCLVESMTEVLNKTSSDILQSSPVKPVKKLLSHDVSGDIKDEQFSQKPVILKNYSLVRQANIDPIKFRKNTEKFCYGNHVTNRSKWDNSTEEDSRLRLFNPSFFRQKDILDIGCNTGQIVFHIAKHWEPNTIIGIDIDKKLIDHAEREIRLHLSKGLEADEDFPEFLAAMYGPLSKIATLHSQPNEFPNNVSFLQANYVPASEDNLETQKPEFDTILCLRVTKWIHLNFGDDGLKMAFKRMFAQLRNGGVLILEPQPWFTYSPSKKITPEMYKTYEGLRMRPDSICDYLLSDEVGFSSCQLIGRTFHVTKSYRQDIYAFTKGYSTAAEQNLTSVLPYSYDSSWTWNDNYHSLYIENEAQVHHNLSVGYHPGFYSPNIDMNEDCANEEYSDTFYEDDDSHQVLTNEDHYRFEVVKQTTENILNIVSRSLNSSFQ